MKHLTRLHLRLHGLIDFQQAFGPTVENALLLSAEQTDQTSVFLELVPKQPKEILPIERGL
jgi:hypothetical protein